jgi:hypothetical protein
MSIWAQILFAAACFGFSFAVAHFAERLLLFLVGGASDRGQSLRSTAAGNPDLAISKERAGAVVPGEQIGRANPETTSPAR